MWTKNAWAFAEQHGLRLEDCVHFQCTAEHVIARRDGGAEIRNIVAACRHCNLTRHETEDPLPADLYRAQCSGMSPSRDGSRGPVAGPAAAALGRLLTEDQAARRMPFWPACGGRA